MVRVIPGVEVKVVKEIIPPPAYPSGTVALIGTAEKGPELKPVHCGSWREFADTFGADPEYSLTLDAKMCFQNLTNVHSGWDSYRIKDNIYRSAIREEGHVLNRGNHGNNPFIAMPAG